MKIQTFKNKTGLIYGGDQMRIGGKTEGVLKIGNTEIGIIPETDSILPLLFNGCTGEYHATFTDSSGVYDLGKVTVRGGRLTPPHPMAVEIAELRVRAEAAEEECKSLREQIRILGEIFDTNSLNFLIK